MDGYSYYKSSDFDPLIPIFNYLKGQPAIDTGGVLREVFSDVFRALANNEVIKNIFVGSEDKILPAFRNELVVKCQSPLTEAVLLASISGGMLHFTSEDLQHIPNSALWRGHIVNDKWNSSTANTPKQSLR